MEKSFFEQIGGTYHREGDYLLPNLTPLDSIPIGVWGQRRRHYLKTYRNPAYTALLLSGELDRHLAEIDQQAAKMFSQIVQQMAKQEGITEQLKVNNQMEWIGQMNNVRNRVEEIIYSELIYV